MNIKNISVPRVKICCISSIEEPKIAIEHGASALGLVGKMPSGPGVISDELISEIAQSVPPPISTFLLTSEISKFVDALLLDSGNPNLQVKELGGTGRTHNWTLSRKIRDSIEIPLFLAGGLNSENVREAINAVQPFGLDLCSSVRTDGKLDAQKLDAFFKAISGN